MYTYTHKCQCTENIIENYIPSRLKVYIGESNTFTVRLETHPCKYADIPKLESLKSKLCLVPSTLAKGQLAFSPELS